VAERPARTTTFGWPGDGGLGERLIEQIIRGTKTATCAFRAAYDTEDPSELAGTFSGAGELFAVEDASGRHRCTIRVTEVFECPFGHPDPRLVAGEGDGDDVAKFQADHRVAWGATMGDRPLTDEESLVVELFELVAVEPF
jgi:uncharacterized protein YhfF